MFPPAVAVKDGDKMEFSVQADIIRSGYDRKTCWVLAQAGVIPPNGAVITMQKGRLTASDVFYGINSIYSEDMGRTWSEPVLQKGLDRQKQDDGTEIGICGLWPKWHAKTDKLLGIGHTVCYLNDEIAPPPRRRDTAYSVYDAATREWSDAKLLQMGDREYFFNTGAGAAQRVDLPDGEVLLPIYFGGRDVHGVDFSCLFKSTVLRCRFDGENLEYVEHGDELCVPVPRGLYEPSLAHYDGKFFLTMRNAEKGYVSVSDDGLSFSEPKGWTFDDGEDLGNYETQQHWLTHSDGLFLVYTRRGANNDHVFRHRAPLFMAQVDTDRLCVIRETEQVVIPERGARIGNFNTAAVSADESWVVVSEWMQTNPPNCFDCTQCEKYGSDNSVFIGRVRWAKPNRLIASG